MADTSLVFNLLAKDKISGKLGGIGNKFHSMSKVILGGAAAAGVGLAKAGMEFDKAYDVIRTGTGTTGKALEGLKSDFKNVVKDVPADFETASAAIADLNTMTGATGKTLQGMTKGVLEASRVLGEDGTANAKLFGQAMQQWQIPAKEGSSKLDALFKSTQKYGIGLNEVIGHLNEYGPVLQNAGFTMEETTALFGQLNKSGLSVSRVMPGLNKAFRDWADEGKNVQKELSGTVSRIADAKSSTKALKIASEAFGAEGAQRMTTAIRSGSLSLSDLKGALKGADGAIKNASEGTESWQEKLQKLKNQGLVALEPIAMRVFDALTTGAEKLQDLQKWAERNATTVKAFGIGLGVLAGIIVTTSAVLKIHAGIMATVRAATVVATAVQWAWNAAMTANPIGLIVAAIAVLIGIIVLAWKKNETFRKVVLAVWGAMKNTWKATVDLFTNVLWPALKTAWNAVVAVAKWVGKNVVRQWNILKKGISIVVRVAGRLITGWVRGTKRVISTLRSIPGRVIGYFRRLKDGAIRKAKALLSWIRRLPGRIKRGLGNTGAMLLGAGRDIIRGLINGIKQMAGRAVSAAKGVARDAIAGAKNLLRIGSPSKVFAGFGRDIGAGLAGGMESSSSLVAKASEKLSGASVTPAAEAVGSRPEAPARGRRRSENVVVIDIRGGDEDMRRLIRRWVRTDNLLQGS